MQSPKNQGCEKLWLQDKSFSYNPESIYFYKELWVLFTLVKCTEFEGYTGVDYRDVKGLATGADETEKRIATATDQIKNPLAHMGEFSAVYNKTNKVVNQGEVTGIKYGTLLYYPKVGSTPKVIYYII